MESKLQFLIYHIFSRKLGILFFSQKICQRPAGCLGYREEWKLWPLNWCNMSFKRTMHHFINCQWLCSLSEKKQIPDNLIINEHVSYDQWWILETLCAFLQLKPYKYQLPLTIRCVESKLATHPRSSSFVPDLFHVCVQNQNAPTRNNRRLTQSLISGTNNSLHRSRRLVPLLSILCHYKTRKQDTECSYKIRKE